MKNIREILAVMWSIASIVMLGYVLIRFGDKVEILTLIIGTLTGTIIGGIYGFYFSSTHKDKPTSSETLTTTETLTENNSNN